MVLGKFCWGFSSIIVYMQKILIGLIALALLVGSYLLFFNTKDETKTVPTVAVEQISLPELDFSFSYPSGQEALGFVRADVGLLDNSEDLLDFYLLTTNEVLQNPEDGTPNGSISIFVFESPESLSTNEQNLSAIDKLKSWASSRSGFTTYSAELAVEEIKIDGVPAITFVTEDEFTREVVISRHKKRMYLLVAQYIEEGGMIDEAFDVVKDSVVFD